MPMTEDDFRALLADRSRDASGTPDPVTAVHHRIHQRQVRTRSVLAAVAVAAIALAALGVPSVLSRDRNNNPTTETIDPSFTRPVEPAPTMPTPSPSPAPSATPLPDFATGAPVFAFGGKLLAGGVLHSPAEGDITITFTPTDWNLAIANWCSSGWPSDKVSFVVTTVNGHNLFGGTCGAGFGKLGDVTPGSEEAAWRDLGVELGKPSTFSASIRQGPMTGRLPLDQSSSPQMAAKRPHGTMTVGVYQRVIVSDYPLPDSPVTLATPQALSYGSTPPPTLVTGMNGTYAMTAVATSDRNDRTLLVEHVAPGQIRVLVNGVLIDLVESWDYTDASAIIPLDVASLAHFGVRVRAGQKVSVAIQTTRFAAQRTWAAYQQQN